MLEKFLSSKFANNLVSLFENLPKPLHLDVTRINDIKIIALILIFLAMLIFIVLVFFIIIRDLFSFFKRKNIVLGSGGRSEKESDENTDESDLFDLQEKKELELELQKELDMALAQKAELENKKKLEKEEKIRAKKEKEIKNKKETKKIAKNDKVIIDFDWKKQKDFSTKDTKIDSSMLVYTKSSTDLHQLYGLLLDMLSRGVDDLKIFQTLNYKSQGLANEGDILKFVDAVKIFVRLCKEGKFDDLISKDDLPDCEQALFHLANNDVSLALVLLEKLMDNEINKVAKLGDAKQRQIFTAISNYACCMGTLAEKDDLMLATSVYETAIELNSTNVTAWSRLADVYRTTEAESRAIWAYQKAYSFADMDMVGSETANACKYLSGYLYAQGNSLQSVKMYNVAKEYYDSLGINNTFSVQEIDAINIITDNLNKNMPETISKLLQKSR